MNAAFSRPVIFIIVVLLSGGLLLGWWLQRNRVEWERNYEQDSPEPFGTSLLYEQMPALFPEAEVVPVSRTVFDHLVYQPERQGLYVFINDEVPLYAESSRELLSFVAAGNRAFVAAYALPPALEAALDVQGGAPLNLMGMLQGIQAGNTSTDTLTLALAFAEGTYRFPERDADYFWDLPRESQARVLGRDEKERPNFIEVRYGEGRFYLHSHPNLLGNYYLVDAQRRRYAESVLTYLPPVDTIYWDAYYKKANLQFRSSERREGTGKNDNPERPNLLAYMFSQPALAWALGPALAGVLIFAVFEAKRKQRVIPQVDPLPNSTLDFSETIGRLYFQNGDHLNLARKRLRVLLEHLRSHYFLDTQRMDADFKLTLVGKTGLAPEEAEQLVDAIERVQRRADLTAEELVQFNRLVEAFYQKTR